MITLLQVAVRSPLWEYGSQLVMFILGCLAFVKTAQEFIKAGNERHRVKEEEATKRANHILDVQLELDKVRAEVEIEKAKQKSFALAEVMKIWEHVNKVQQDMLDLKECEQNASKNYEQVKEVLSHLQKNVDNVMKAFFDTFKR